MGDAGVASMADINSQHWNPAKYAFAKSTSGIALSYTPWLRNFINDMNLAYLTGYHQLDEFQTLSGSLRYFDLGSMVTIDESMREGQKMSPNEFAVDFGYSRKLSNELSGSVALRYIRSDIFNGLTTSDMKAGNAFAADVAFFYTKNFRQNRKESNMAYGINISNIGSKISYDGGTIFDFIPTNLRIGGSYTTEIDKYNKVSFNLDFNKLLVPTFPVDSVEDDGSPLTGLGYNNMNSIEGIFVSFADAPGGFKEEMQEIMVSLGAEYWYSDQFAVRAGYFNEAENKGDRKFLTFGAGLRMNVFSLDFSYIYTLTRTSPLENTLRFTLGFDIDDFRNQGKKGRRR
jgi:hypothetical protein